MYELTFIYSLFTVFRSNLVQKIFSQQISRAHFSQQLRGQADSFFDFDETIITLLFHRIAIFSIEHFEFVAYMLSSNNVQKVFFIQSSIIIIFLIN